MYRLNRNLIHVRTHARTRTCIRSWKMAVQTVQAAFTLVYQPKTRTALDLGNGTVVPGDRCESGRLPWYIKGFGGRVPCTGDFWKNGTTLQPDRCGSPTPPSQPEGVPRFPPPRAPQSASGSVRGRYCSAVRLLAPQGASEASGGLRQRQGALPLRCPTS